MGHIDLAAPVSHIWFLRGVPSRLGLLLDISSQNLEKVIYFANFIVTSVDESLKEGTLEQLKNEYKSKRKQIKGQYKNQIAQATKAGEEKEEKGGKGGKGKAVELEVTQESELSALDEEYSSTEKALKDLTIRQIISEQEYQELSLKFGHIFEAGIGAEAIYSLLKEIDLSKMSAELNSEAEKATGAKKSKLVKRAKLIYSLDRNDIRPEWMIMTVVPIIPPDLRPMVPLDGGRFATSDLNDLYRRVINRNNRLKKLKELNAPEVIIRNEKRMLQEAVDALIDNSARSSKTTTASTGQKRQLKSIADILKGKQGRFRQNLLGKRIDYSGRSVIVVGPKLGLGQCGLPKKMALELFKPFVISQLIKREYVHNIRSANRFIETGRSEVWDILEEIVADAHVFLNRAPTLHRLGIQAFKPILIEGKAIQLHPLVCSAFNADFDGDQMAVHVPLTEQAKEEARDLMASVKNLLKPATGQPVVTPKMDIVWGCYYITSYDEIREEPKVFADTVDALAAYGRNVITLRERIKVRMPRQGEIPAGEKLTEIVETNSGRIIFNGVLPEGLPYYNEQITTKVLSAIVKFTLDTMGSDATVQLLDNVKNLGYQQLKLSGHSWGMDDLPDVAVEKGELLKGGDKDILEIHAQYEDGLLTKKERHTKIIEVWTEIKDKIATIGREKLDINSSVFSMVTAGARGSWGQVTQMVGMKGLVTNPAGEVIELPIKASFKEGFDVLEYFISTHGSRKGLSDTALRTANAGYLTRRLVDVAQDIVVSMEDCGDTKGTLYTKKESEEIGVDLMERVWGRISLQTIKDPETGETIVKKNEMISENALLKLRKIDLDEITVRSVLSCHLSKGVCRECYGIDLGRNGLVGLGEAVGIVAAQSIGEPGTQLTMRTFHQGGVAGSDITQGLPRVEELFEARAPKRKAFISEVDGKITVKEGEREIQDERGRVIVNNIRGQKILSIKYDTVEEDEYKIPSGSKVKVKDGKTVTRNTVIITDGKDEIKPTRGGIVKVLTNSVKVIVEAKGEKEYIIPPGYRIWVKDGEVVNKGDQLTEGSVDLHQLFKLKGKDAVKKYIVEEIQYIYSSQGQKLNEKHIELIIRQLFSRVQIKDPGDTNLLPGEIVEKAEFEEENDAISAKQEKATAEELFLGITKVSLSTRSFLSAASFQETSKVLINAAITGKIDRLEGLKENVIIGRLIPAGTGFKPSMAKKMKK
jgi:DNA-directed RNA polymerase subunit beta'